MFLRTKICFNIDDIGLKYHTQDSKKYCYKIAHRFKTVKI